MRGHLSPAIRPVASEQQVAFAALTRGRRSKLAKIAQTTLVKADQWARGEWVEPTISDALSKALDGFKARKKA